MHPTNAPPEAHGFLRNRRALQGDPWLIAHTQESWVVLSDAIFPYHQFFHREFLFLCANYFQRWHAVCSFAKGCLLQVLDSEPRRRELSSRWWEPGTMAGVVLGGHRQHGTHPLFGWSCNFCLPNTSSYQRYSLPGFAFVHIHGKTALTQKRRSLHCTNN